MRPLPAAVAMETGTEAEDSRRFAAMHPLSLRQLTLRESDSLRFARRFAPSNRVRCHPTGEPRLTRFPPRGGKRTGFAGSRQATENPVRRFPVWEVPRSGDRGAFLRRCRCSGIPAASRQMHPPAFGSSPEGGAKFLASPFGGSPAQRG